MRCLYEVLGIAKEADESTIRKAYRKGALAWHPDKNQGNLEEADARFKELQNAWEVLSDPREKTWYDSHRNQILRAGRHQAGGDGGPDGHASPPEDISLFQYFSSSCYSGFNDAPRGFYTVYGKVFLDLGTQEGRAVEGLRNRQAHVAPCFGKADSPWSEVSAFYQYWLYFVSDRSFAWADIHNPASAPNRKVRRLMEDDNNRQRKATRREFQENVRALVAFVRKRDARVIAWMEQEEMNKAEREAIEKSRKEEESAERMRRALEYEEPEWVREADTGSCNSEGAALIEDELYCIACDKFFRSEKAFANHERSKKHMQNAEVLQMALAEEEDQTPPVAAEHSCHTAESTLLASQADVTDPTTASAQAWQVKSAEHAVAAAEAEDLSESADAAGSIDGRANQPILETSTASEMSSDSPQEEEDEDEDASLARMVQSHMKLGSRTMQEEETLRAGLAQDTQESASGKGAAQPACRFSQIPDAAYSAVSDEPQIEGIALEKQPFDEVSSHYAPPSHGLDLQEMHAGAQGVSAHDHKPHSGQSTTAVGCHYLNSSCLTQQGKAVEGGAAGPELTDRVSDSTDVSQTQAKRRKGKKRLARKKEQKADSSGPLTCQVCKEAFDTRTLLFKHINEHGHAKPLMH